jgi:hypothetical protein
VSEEKRGETKRKGERREKKQTRMWSIFLAWPRVMTINFSSMYPRAIRLRIEKRFHFQFLKSVLGTGGLMTTCNIPNNRFF